MEEGAGLSVAVEAEEFEGGHFGSFFLFFFVGVGIWEGCVEGMYWGIEIE